MTMAFSTDNLKSIDEDSTKTNRIMNHNNLNLEDALRAAASTTVKLLRKRNINSDTHNNSGHDDDDGDVNYNQVDNVIISTDEDNDIFNETEYATTAAKNLSATITTIRSNVTKVLYTNFQNQTAANVTQPGSDNTQLTQLSTYKSPLATASSTLTRIATTMTSEILQSSTYTSGNRNNSNLENKAPHATTEATALIPDNSDLNKSSNNVIKTTMTHLNELLNATAITATTPYNSTVATAAIDRIATNTTIMPSITYPNLAIHSYNNCSALFANYTQPQQGLFCNWVWDKYLCWPPTPAGVLALMNCPSGYHGVDSKKFAHRQCQLNGHWGSKPNDSYNPIGWTDYNPCWKQEVKTLLDKVSNLLLLLFVYSFSLKKDRSGNSKTYTHLGNCWPYIVSGGFNYIVNYFL